MFHLCEEHSIRISLHHKNPYIFFQSQWQKEDEPSIIYLVYRWLLTIFLVVSMLYCVIAPGIDKPIEYTLKWPIYVTHWGYIFCLIQSLLCTIPLTGWLVSTKKHEEKEDENKIHPWVFKTYMVYWVINTIATVKAPCISVLYWAIVYDGVTKIDTEEVLVHIINSVVMFLELCIVKHPIYVCHFYCPVGFISIYGVFNLTYYLAGGTSRKGDPFIYGALDWSDMRKAGLCCVGSLLLVIFLHCICSWISTLRMALHMKIFPTDI